MVHIVTGHFGDRQQSTVAGANTTIKFFRPYVIVHYSRFPVDDRLLFLVVVRLWTYMNG